MGLLLDAELSIARVTRYLEQRVEVATECFGYTEPIYKNGIQHQDYAATCDQVLS